MWVLLLFLPSVHSVPSHLCLSSLPLSFPPSPPAQIPYSFKTLGDLGDYQSCIAHQTHWYVLIQTKPEPRPELSGLCPPLSCAFDDIQWWLDSQNYTEDGQRPIAVRQEEWRLGIAGAGVLLGVCGLVLAVGGATYVDWRLSRRAEAWRQREIPLEPLSGTYYQSISPLVPQESRFLLCFSIYKSVDRLISTEGRDPSLAVLDIWKTVSWVSVVASSMYVNRYFGPSTDRETAGGQAANWSTAVVAYAGVFAVDSFLWVTAVIYTYTALSRLSSGQRTRFISPIVSRALQSFPLLLCLLLLSTQLLPSLSSGPIWSRHSLLISDCHQYWWTVLTYSSNLIPDGCGNNCLDIAWAFALDLQLFALLPLAVFAYNRLPCGVWWAGCGLNIGFSLLMATSLAGYYGYTVAYISLRNYRRNFTLNFLAKPFARVGASLLGVSAGAVAFEGGTGQGGDSVATWVCRTIRKNRGARIGCVLAGTALIVGLLIAQRPGYADAPHDYEGWSPASNALFLALQHPLFALSLTLLSLPLLLAPPNGLPRLATMTIWRVLARLAVGGGVAAYTVERTMWAREMHAYDWKETTFLWDFVVVSAGAAGIASFVYFLVGGVGRLAREAILGK